ASDTMVLATVMYIIVFFTSIALITKRLVDNQNKVKQLEDSISKSQEAFLQIISNRKSVRIPFDEILYVESFSDCVKINMVGKKEVVSKERLSSIEKMVPATFLRIHRSFIVNIKFITRFDYNEVEIGGAVLNIGRTYKGKVLPTLKEGRGYVG
ncbi:MAG: LytTR family transcriptional regulator DNA-binding domain-containing protein, partial [Bacteroidales bacterium]|nr:LytTR family transcriptional regulator DNA-binding domain-containing protein [Bacteroidales bacterium]